MRSSSLLLACLLVLLAAVFGEVEDEDYLQAVGPTGGMSGGGQLNHSTYPDYLSRFLGWETNQTAIKS